MTNRSDSYGDASTRGPIRLGPGTMLGVYRLDEPLGRGGMGLVWKAWDTASRRTVALKLLPPEFHGHDDAIAEVRAAFDLVQAVTHHAINKAIALAEDEQHGPYLVLEFLPGITLTKFAKKSCRPDGTLPLELVIQLLRPVAIALDYGHKKGLLHRDVKPDNILVEDQGGEPGDIWLIDYGLAAAVRATTVTHTNAKVDTRGTRPYMAPEQLKGKPKLWDGRTDQYALAVVAYELLAGHRPFIADDDSALMFAIMSEEVEPIEGLADGLNTVLLTALAKLKDDRYPSCIAFLDALAAASSVGWTEALRVPPTNPEKAVELADSFHPTTTPWGRWDKMIGTLKAPPLMRAPFDTAAAKAGQTAWAQHLGVPVIEMNEAGIEMVLIPPGEFLMGSSDADVAAALESDSELKTESMNDERPQHPVQITQPFRLGIYPVLQREFKLVMGHNPSAFSPQGSQKGTVERVDSLRLPVENVTWFDAVVFCNKLSERCELPPYYRIGQLQWNGSNFHRASSVELLGGNGYRLSTEAEWEYACRAGTTSAFWFGNMLAGSHANTASEKPYGLKNLIFTQLGRPSVVGNYGANPFGCFDQHGNIWEWCEDCYDADFYGSSIGTVVNPICTLNQERRVHRGGAWNSYGRDARSAVRGKVSPNCSALILGFRLARTA